uniref:NtCtMGAM_N domain-containing protein n=1 Tax=Trichuris muris TaxID=70415 RepID=A0A5S6QM25_TRIMR
MLQCFSSSKQAIENKRIVNIALFVMLLVFVAVVIVLGVLIGPKNADPLYPAIITDCAPDWDGIDVFSCQERQCVWVPEVVDGAPRCQIPQDHKGYSVEAKLTATTGTLIYEGIPFYGPVISPVVYDVHPVDANIFRFTISDANHERYRVPDSLVPISLNSREDVTETNCCRIELCTGPFGVRIWQVIEQLTSVIGRPALPPYWALGFHLSRWGYDSTMQIEELVDRMEQSLIPLDVQWVDIDIMKYKYSFTYDSCSSYWTDLPAMVKRLKKRGIRTIVLPMVSAKEYRMSLTLMDSTKTYS